MSKKRRHYNAEFKFQMAMEAAIGIKTTNQLAAEHQIHPNQITNWKRRCSSCVCNCCKSWALGFCPRSSSAMGDSPAGDRPWSRTDERCVQRQTSRPNCACDWASLMRGTGALGRLHGCQDVMIGSHEGSEARKRAP